MLEIMSNQLKNEKIKEGLELVSLHTRLLLGCHFSMKSVTEISKNGPNWSLFLPQKKQHSPARKRGPAP